MRSHSPSNSSSLPATVIFVVPKTFNINSLMNCLKNLTLSSKSQYDAYHSTCVNSCKWVGSMPSLRKSLPNSNTLSKPAQLTILSHVSVAMRKLQSKSRALWCVKNGFALAPLTFTCKTGVSTSKKPFFSR